MEEKEIYKTELAILHSDMDDITKIKLIQQQVDIKRNTDFVNFQNSFMALRTLQANKTNNPNINMVTIKKGVQIDGYLFRMQNITDGLMDDVLTVGETKINLHFNKYEVKTILYKDGKLEEINQMLI